MKSQFKFVLLFLLALAMIGASFGASTVLADDPVLVPLNPDHVGAVNSEFGDPGICPTPPSGQEGWFGWHFIMPGNNDFTSLSVTFQNAGVKSANPFPGTLPGTVFVADPDNSHAYIWTPTDDTLLAGSATSDGENRFFNLSHTCPFVPKEALTVTKTAVTSFTRTHNWDIAKSVDTEGGYEHENFPKIWLYTDGSGNETATWKVDVSYEGSVDSLHNVSGNITINNTGDLDATITIVADELAETLIDVDCGETLPYVLAVDATLICTYSEDGFVEGENNVRVTTEKGYYDASADIIWGAPTTEVNKTVSVKDISDLFGEVGLGTVTAPDGDTFTYTKDFAWADYGAVGCGDYTYNNTATIVGTPESASATLKVNVQCYIFETAYAKGSNGINYCFIPDFDRWGWTNKITQGTYTWPLWAGAAQCDTTKGTLVGTVTVNYGANNVVTVTYNLDPGYLLQETHVYAGYGKYPLFKGKATVAPGQYTNSSIFNGTAVYVIAHAVVGIPDPDFGP